MPAPVFSRFRFLPFSWSRLALSFSRAPWKRSLVCSDTSSVHCGAHPRTYHRLGMSTKSEVLFQEQCFWNRQLAKLLSGNEVRARSRSRLCRRLSIDVHSFAIDMVSKSFLSTISSRFGDVLTITIYLQIFCEFKTHFFFRGRRPIFSTGNVDGVAWLVLVRSFIAYLKLWASFFFN